MRIAKSVPIQVINQTRGTTICLAASLADTSRTRLFGLLGQGSLSPDAGLLIRPSSGVHTWGMRFAIDIIAMDAQSCILGLWQSVGPWKIRGLSLKTRSVLELAPGTIAASRSEVGDKLEFSRAVMANTVRDAHKPVAHFPSSSRAVAHVQAREPHT